MTQATPQAIETVQRDDVFAAQECMSVWLVFRKRMREEARRLGYTLAVHGSMKRDIDLVAVPWIQKAAGQPLDWKVVGWDALITPKPYTTPGSTPKPRAPSPPPGRARGGAPLLPPGPGWSSRACPW
jgi:hypothetical protein